MPPSLGLVHMGKEQRAQWGGGAVEGGADVGPTTPLVGMCRGWEAERGDMATGSGRLLALASSILRLEGRKVSLSLLNGSVLRSYQ